MASVNTNRTIFEQRGRLPVKKAILALLLVGVLLLTGCDSMLEQRHLLSLEPYEPVSTSAGNSSQRVENYQELYKAILSMVSAGDEHAVLNLYNYTAQDLEDDLTRACLEVVQEDPLGAYMVDYIKHDYSLIVSYYEVNVNISYRHTVEEMDAIVFVTGSSAIRRELRKTLADFSGKAVLRISYFAEDENYIRELVQHAYYNTPAAALGMPEVSVSLYPASGTNRIVEIDLTYSGTQEALRRSSKELKETAQAIALQADSAQALFDTVSLSLQTEEHTGRNTAYDALINHVADSEGCALAYQLLCDQTSVNSVVVQGTLDGKPRFWNIITEDGSQYRHVDLAAGLFSLTDEELLQAGGYVWDRQEYPTCDSPASPDSENEAQISEN